MPPFGVEDQAEAIAVLGIIFLQIAFIVFGETYKTGVYWLMSAGLSIFLLSLVDNPIGYLIFAGAGLFSFYSAFFRT